MPEPPAPSQQLKRNAQLGMVVLGVRSLLQNLVILLANVYLARWLEPRDFGIFGVLQFAVSFFRLVADTGLGTALVQQKEAPDPDELSTIWWLQVALGVLLTLASFFIAPYLSRVWPSLPTEAALLLPGLALGLLFTMLQSIPFLVLERQMQFGWVGTFEFVGTLTFYGTALWLAARHAGPAALVWASVGQAVLVSVMANIVRPFRPRLHFRLASIRRLFKFGAAFQGSNAIGFVNAAVTPLVVGARLGSGALGIIQFAESTAFFPSLIVGIVRRVYFPFLCRIEGDRPSFQREFEQAVVLCAAPSFFFFGVFAGAGPAIVTIIYGNKWIPAVPALIVYSLGFCFTFFSWIGDAAMAALDDMGRLFRIKVVSAALSWGATLLAVALVSSPFAFAVGYLVQLVLTPLMIFVALRARIPTLRILPRLRGVILGGLALASAGRAVQRSVTGVLTLASFLVAAVVLFTATALLADRELRGIARALWNRWRQGGGDRGPRPLAT